MTPFITALVLITSTLSAAHPVPEGVPGADPDAPAAFAPDVSDEDTVERDDVWATATKTSVMLGVVAAASTLVAAGFLGATMVGFVAPSMLVSSRLSLPLAKSILTPVFLLFGTIPAGAVAASAAGTMWVNRDQSSRTLLMGAAGAGLGATAALIAGTAIGVGGLLTIFGPNKDYLSGLDVSGVAVLFAGATVAPVALTAMGAGGLAGVLVARFTENETSTNAAPQRLGLLDE